jgi:ribosomal protein S8
VDVPRRKLKAEIAKVLMQERYINNFKVSRGDRPDTLRVYLSTRTTTRGDLPASVA